MISLLIKGLVDKLSKHIDEKNGEVTVDASWANNWMSENSAPFSVSIVGKDGKEIKDAKVSITKKSRT